MIETTAEQASSFMRWAAARLAKEVEDNERLVKETGTTDFIGKPESIGLVVILKTKNYWL